ncbi:MAG: serine/threonine-protein kinase [Acidobacteriaceae bacterium]|nr:serine/threonine-protein kinase [Acidobacteriaceae bacterium]
MPTQHQRLKDILDAALDLKPEDRAAFLDRECNGDAELRQQVESLLAADATAASTGTSTTVIGPYHLLQLIGEGGMGQVWLAEQKHPVRRRVAIKLIKAGMDTREVIARFESERQALALMDHPAIAKVFDAGSTPEGRPYFVMEYVAGMPITDYCDRHRLTIRQRMELFVQVCEGVQHAHQKAIIHRDLKPSNILVTEIGGKPMPRIIDFGVAKATSQKLSAGTIYTRAGVMIGTIGYMSPEQADPVSQDVDVRTDVYSLGAVLYELLTGAQPLDFKALAYEEVLRRLDDHDVPRPSTRVTTLGGDSATAAKNRGSDPLTLVRLLRGDPDAIALKALERDRARRYVSASELAADIGRYLRNEPVTAHPPSIAYRARKYVRRHRLGLAVAASAALVVVLLITWWRIPPAVPVVESTTQLTDDGQPKGAMVTDGSRIYFQTGEFGSFRIEEVRVTGGLSVPVETRIPNSGLMAATHNGSALLVTAGNTFIGGPDGPLWLVPLPAGEPRRLGNIETSNADAFPDGRIIFANLVQGKEPKGTDSRTDWLIAEKDGSNPRKLVSLPGFIGEVSVAPDGHQVLLSQNVVGDRRLFEMREDGSGFREITKINEDDYDFIWTPDEKYLVYQSGNARQSDIWLLPMQSGLFRRPGKPIRLTNGPLPYSVPCPGRDGKQIFVFGTKQRGELVRYDMKSHEFKPFLSGISATDPSFSRDGKWLAYASYPDRTLWRSRSDGSDRMQLTFPPMNVYFPSISPDGTKVSFYTGKGEIYVISVEGGLPRKIDDRGLYPNWSPDGNYLYYQRTPTGGGGLIADVRTGQKTPVASSEHKWAVWLSQDTLLAADDRQANFLTFNFKTQKWTDFDRGISGEMLVNWTTSPDGKYLYFTTGGADPKVLRIRIADHQLETIASLKDLHRAVNNGDTALNVAPDGSPIFTRDTGYQEIYALNIRWP